MDGWMDGWNWLRLIFIDEAVLNLQVLVPEK
jgi:hypothetical protein